MVYSYVAMFDDIYICLGTSGILNILLSKLINGANKECRLTECSFLLIDTTEGVDVTSTRNPEDINEDTSTLSSEHIDGGKSALKSDNKVLCVKMEVIYQKTENEKLNVELLAPITGTDRSTGVGSRGRTTRVRRDSIPEELNSVDVVNTDVVPLIEKLPIPTKNEELPSVKEDTLSQVAIWIQIVKRGNNEDTSGAKSASDPADWEISRSLVRLKISTSSKQS